MGFRADQAWRGWSVILTLPWKAALNHTRRTGEPVVVVAGTVSVGVYDLSDIVIGHALDGRVTVTALRRKIPASMKAPTNPRQHPPLRNAALVHAMPVSSLVARLSLLPRSLP